MTNTGLVLLIGALFGLYVCYLISKIFPCKVWGHKRNYDVPDWTDGFFLFQRCQVCQNDYIAYPRKRTHYGAATHSEDCSCKGTGIVQIGTTKAICPIHGYKVMGTPYGR
jgi:hypothetical protein